MPVPGWIAALGVVLLLSSTLLWGLPWNRFTERSRETRRVDSVAFRRTTILVSVGALCSGFLLVVLGFIANFELNMPTVKPILLFLCFVAFPVGFAAVITGMFAMKAATLRTLYKGDKQSQAESKMERQDDGSLVEWKRR